MELSPIVLFTYKKVLPLKRTLKALAENELASESELFIYSDGPGSSEDTKQVAEVREFLKTIGGFKQVTIHESLGNKGLAVSIITGVTEILKTYESVIVLEDDLVTSPNFLAFMNQALAFYATEEKVFSVAGYSFPMKVPNGYMFDNYFTQRASSWGWGTWKNRWQQVDWSVSDYSEFMSNANAKKKFNSMGSDLSGMLEKQMKGKINSWAIRWVFHQFQKQLYTVYPAVSKVVNIGFGDTATHTQGSNSRYATYLDTSIRTNFSFSTNIRLNSVFVKQFVAKYSIASRAYNKLKSILSSNSNRS